MSKRSASTIYTIGHSNHPWDRFAELLTKYKIQALADVRTFPRSRFAQFNQRPLQVRLQEAAIQYFFFGDALGGRAKTGPPQDYEMMARSKPYAEALAKVAAIGHEHRTVLMCSEHEPLTCHRCLLLARSLTDQKVDVRHILRDGNMEDHAETEGRLLALTRKKLDRLSVSPADRLKTAYRMQEQALRRKPK